MSEEKIKPITIEIGEGEEKKKYVLKSNFSLPSDPSKKYKLLAIKEKPTDFSAPLQALLAIDGQKTFIPEEEYKAEVEAAKKAEAEKKAEAKKAAAK